MNWPVVFKILVSVLAITMGLVTTIYLGGLHVDFLHLLGLQRLAHPAPIKISFTWFALIGAGVVFAVGIFFKTPSHVLRSAIQQAADAQRGEAKPLSLREA